MNRSLLVLLAFACAQCVVAAETVYPARPIRIVVPSAPGGGTDIVARLVAQALQERWGQTLVVDNRGGAGGIPAVAMVARNSAPDGYTMCIGSNGHLSFAPAIHRNLTFDPQKDLAPSTLAANQAFVVAGAAGVPAATMQELIALAKSKPGLLRYGSGGTGTASHLGTELLQLRSGATLLHVPYKGTGPGLTALLGGEIQVLLVGLATVLPYMRGKSDKLKVFAVTGSQRASVAPEIPTVAESGVPGYSFDVWYGVVFPGATPRAIVQKTSAELRTALAAPALRERFAAAGLEPLSSTPEEFRDLIRREVPRWKEVARLAKIQVD